MAKRIGMILDAVYPPDPRVENEALTLIKNGFEVFLFCLTYSNKKSVENSKGIEIRRYVSNKLEYKLSALAYTFPFYHLSMKRKIQHFIINNKIDILHVHDMRIGRAVFWANKKSKLTIVLDLHDNFPEIMKFYPHVTKFPGKYLINPSNWKKAEEKLISESEKVITVSPQFVDDLKLRFTKEKEKFILVQNSVTSGFYTNYEVDQTLVDKYKKNFVLLYLGDTHLRRGLLTAIKSLPILSNKIPNIKLVVVGKSSTDPVLKNEVKNLSLEKYVDFEGWQKMYLFQSYILASDIGICPLERNKQHDVAYANKLFQYMSLGLPVLVSNAKAQEKIVLEYKVGLVHKEKDPEDFAAKVLSLYSNPEMTSDMGMQAKKAVKNKFSWEQTSKELITLYEELTS